MNNLKWAIGIALLLAATIGNYVFSEQLIIYRIIGVVILVALAMIMFLQTTQGKVVLSFLQDARTELRKVVWPSRKETVQATGTVIAMVVFTSILLWIIDTVLLYIMIWITGQGG